MNAPTYRGEQYIDGGFSDNQPGKLEPGSITVSPFSGESDICPSDEDSAGYILANFARQKSNFSDFFYLFRLFGFDFCGTAIQFTTQNLFRMVTTLFPPSPEICSRICRQGFEDTLRFLTKICNKKFLKLNKIKMFFLAMAPCVKCLTVSSNAAPAADEQLLDNNILPKLGALPRRNVWRIRALNQSHRAATVANGLNM